MVLSESMKYQNVGIWSVNYDYFPTKRVVNND